MSDRGIERFDRYISDLQARLERAKAIRVMMAEDATLHMDVTMLLASVQANGHVQVPKSAGLASGIPQQASSRPTDKYLEPVVKVFADRPPGTWLAIREIAVASGVAPHNVHTVVKKKCSELFVIDIKSPKVMFFQLKDHPKGGATT